MADRRAISAATRRPATGARKRRHQNQQEAGPPTIQEETEADLDVHIMEEWYKELKEEQILEREQP